MNAVDARPVKLCWVALTGLIVLLVLGMTLAFMSKALVLTPPCIGVGLLLGLTLLVMVKLVLARRQAIEEENLVLYREEHPGTELFEDSDEALRLAARAHRTYSRIVVPVAAIALGVVGILFGLLYWGRWNAAPSFLDLRNPLQFAVLSFGLFVGTVIAGSYLVGLSREKGYRWLRPTGAWLFFAGGLYLLGGVMLISQYLGIHIAQLDLRVAKIGLVLVMIVGVEMVINVVMEFYRPRSLDGTDRPVFESRLLALFTEPGGLARNVAASLDYQFGFKVSEAWFYRFMERAVIPFAIAMVLCFWLMTCFVVVETEENGIRERFGRVTQQEALGPGLYFKLPWPLARIGTFPVQRVQVLPVGYVPGDTDDANSPAMPEQPMEEMGDMTGRVIVWSKSHNKEEVNFVVASTPETFGEDIDGVVDPQARTPVSVYLMAASIPLYFKVDNLYDYAYRHADAHKALEAIANAEVTRYLASVDFFDLIARGRAAGSELLRERIQAAATRDQLGIRVVFVGLQGIHPPVRVGAEFNAVVSAMQEKHTKVLEAQRYAMTRQPKAEAEAVELTSGARRYSIERTLVPEAEAERFEYQLRGYLECKDLFVLRSFLDVLEETTADTRKYIIATDQGQEVVIIDLQEKLRPDLLDIDLDRQE